MHFLISSVRYYEDISFHSSSAFRNSHEEFTAQKEKHVKRHMNNNIPFSYAASLVEKRKNMRIWIYERRGGLKGKTFGIKIF